MKATIEMLWETGINIVCYDNPENEGFNAIGEISELKKCENVLIEKAKDQKGYYHLLIDGCKSLFLIKESNFSHPTGCGRLNVIEIL